MAVYRIPDEKNDVNEDDVKEDEDDDQDMLNQHACSQIKKLFQDGDDYQDFIRRLTSLQKATLTFPALGKK